MAACVGRTEDGRDTREAPAGLTRRRDVGPDRDIALVAGATERLLTTAAGLGDDAVAGPSALPGWSVGHVLGHLARNADSHTRRAEGAARGELVPQYSGGPAGRAAEIEAAARRPAAEAVADLQEACERLARAWAAMPAEAWARSIDSMGTEMPASEAPVSRLVEVEVHHADLGLDYRPRHWPPVAVAPMLAYVTGRLVRRAAGVTGPEASWHLHATDGEGEWLVRRTPNGTTVDERHERADCAVRGPQSALLAWLLGRGSDHEGRLELLGDAELARVFPEVYPFS